MSTNPPCPQCGDPVKPNPYKGGKPKIYCSHRCANRAAYLRRPGAAPSRPTARTRRPLPEFATDAGWSLRKDIERLERIFADDRFPASKNQVATRVRSHLTYAAEVCQDLLSRLDTEG